MFYLEARADGFAKRVAIPMAKSVIGRSRDADIVLQHPSISKAHAAIEPRGPGRFLITDLGSSNGIEVDGIAMERVELTVGDRVRLGPVTLSLRQKATPAEQPAAALSAPAPSGENGGRSWRLELWLGGGLLVVLLALGPRCAYRYYSA